MILNAERSKFGIYMTAAQRLSMHQTLDGFLLVNILKYYDKLLFSIHDEPLNPNGEYKAF